MAPADPEARTLAVGVPHSRRNLWQPQTTIFDHKSEARHGENK